MKHQLAFFLFVAFGLTLASAETYRSVAISELKIEGPKEAVASAMEQQVDAYQLRMLDARIEAESYLTFDDPEDGELPQSLLRLVFKGDVKLPLKGAIDLAMDYSADEVKTFHFTIPAGKVKEIKEEDFLDARQRWAEVRALYGLPGMAWFNHQANHGDQDEERTFDPAEVMQTYDIFSGGRAIADNLALDRELILAAGKDEAMVRIDTIKGVTVKAIDWAPHLPKEPVAIDSLAMSIPEDQHALFAPSLHGLLKLMKRGEAETSPMVGMISSQSSYRGLMTRYRRQMGLDLTDAAARLLPVRSVAVTGGDLYFATGTDVAILMETDKPDALFKALELAIRAQAGSKAAVSNTDGSGAAGGYQLRSYVNPEKGISSHLCRTGNMVFVTNSKAQVRRLSEVAGKQFPALGMSEEFKVFRHRYPKADEDAYLFLSDATIRRWAGPVTRIGASRRNRALAALNELTCRGLSQCKKSEDEYAALLGRVAMVDGRAISEHYGSAEFLTPISELGLSEVSQTEKEAYDMWRDGYETGWTQVFDPIAIQLKAKGDSLDVDLTVLPLNVNSDIREVMDVAGEAKLSPRARLRPKDSLLHFACAIDSKSEYFQKFDQQLVTMMPDLKIKPLSWVGESVSIDLLDSLYWEGVGNMGIGEHISHLPVVARVEVKSKIKLGLFLTAMRTLMQTSAPDTFEWINRKHGDRSYVVIAQQDDDDFGEQIKICYAIVGRALIVTLNERQLKRAIDLEQLELTDQQLADLPEAGSMMIDVDPGMLNVIDRMESRSTAASRLAKTSWQAIPILNEWRLRFPDRDPRKVHEGMFGVSIDCPGGKGYRWNEEHLTMESVVYGHRGAPRVPEQKQGLLKYQRMHSGMDFIDDGLRLRLHLGPKAELPSLPEPELGEVIGKGIELNSYRPGKILSYAGDDAFGAHSWKFEVISTEKTPKGLLVRTNEPWQDEEDQGQWQGSYLIDDDGIWQTGGSDEFNTTTFSKPSLDLPLELRLNAVHRVEAFGQDVYEEGETREIEAYRERTVLRVLGKETLKTKAGVFKDCVVVERYSESLWSEYYDAVLNKEWYHPGTGLIKTEDENGHGGVLIKIEDKK